MKIIVLCPAGSTTGGAENLHQLVNALRSHGGDAYISYYPDEAGKGTKEFFEQYGAPVHTPADSTSNIIIIPENSTFLARKYPKSTKVIFWLSIDNYLNRKGDSWRTDIYKYFRSLQTTRMRISTLQDCLHIAQSSYATHFLAKRGLHSYYIGDYLNDDFNQAKEMSKLQKLDQVLFNPKKGSQYIKRLQVLDPNISFKPIINMTRDEVYSTMMQSKIYIDLGLHPGKDRIPREAVSMGCCIMTCKKGSARNPFDVPIPAEYKFDLKRAGLIKILDQVRTVFSDFDARQNDFDHYRKVVRNEKISFLNNTTNLLDIISSLSRDR
jgi:hypothetical protein